MGAIRFFLGGTTGDRRLAFTALLLLQLLALAFVVASAQVASAQPRIQPTKKAASKSKSGSKGKSKKKSSFAQTQRRHPRVKAARAVAQGKVEKSFADAGLEYPPKHVFIRVIKDEDVVELWGANSRSQPMVLVRSFAVCARSGSLGPKRQQGDLQVPEGFYVMSRFNPWSSYHLSLGVNYPNAADRIKGRRPLGGDILIHGDCVTIGCIPIENGPIEELYVALLDARLNGQRKIPLHIFPARLDDKGLENLIARVDGGDSRIAFWRGLAPGYRAFATSNVVPKVSVSRLGEYVVRAKK